MTELVAAAARCWQSEAVRKSGGVLVNFGVWRAGSTYSEAAWIGSAPRINIHKKGRLAYKVRCSVQKGYCQTPRSELPVTPGDLQGGLGFDLPSGCSGVRGLRCRGGWWERKLWKGDSFLLTQDFQTAGNRTSRVRQTLGSQGSPSCVKTATDKQAGGLWEETEPIHRRRGRAFIW